MDRSRRDEQDVALLQHYRGLTGDIILEQTLEDVDDLFTRMDVFADRRSWVKVDTHLDRLVSRDAEVVSLEFGPPGAGSCAEDEPGRENADRVSKTVAMLSMFIFMFVL
jgi:hypothetical protein